MKFVNPASLKFRGTGRQINLNEDILMVDKPEGWTSHDVVAKVRGELREKYGRKINPAPTRCGIKVGHGGTLDPMATGVLLVLIGKATKRFEEIRGWEKEYLMKVKLGKETDSLDRTGRTVKKKKPRELKEEEVRQAVKSFQGEYEQKVPMYSAVKIKGQKMYQLARAGKKIKQPKKMVKIKEIELLSLQGLTLKVRVVCGSGTYMRQLAVDICQKLGELGCVEELRRIRVGEFR